MFCPKCNDIELTPVTQDKLEYLACLNGCEGVWVERSSLEKYWGKKRLKKLEDKLIEIKQPDFNEDILTEKNNDDEDIEYDTSSSQDDDDDDDEDALYEDDEEEQDLDDEEDEYNDNIDDDEDFDDEVEEVNFSDQRGLRMSFINDDGEYDDPVNETADNFNETPDLIEEDDDDSIQIEEEETFFLTSPASGNPMKRLSANLSDKITCSIGWCADSQSYWVDCSDEVLSVVLNNQKAPQQFAELLAYDRPEEEIFEDDEDEDDI